MNIRNFGTDILVWQETERLNACKLNKSSVVLMCNLISTSHTPSFDSFEGWVLNSVLLRVQTELRRYYRVEVIHGSQNSYPNPKRPVNMLHGTDPDPYFIWKWDPNPCRPEKCLKCTTRTRRGPDHYSKVGPEPGWEDTDPTAPKKKIGLNC